MIGVGGATIAALGLTRQIAVVIGLAVITIIGRAIEGVLIAA